MIKNYIENVNEITKEIINEIYIENINDGKRSVKRLRKIGKRDSIGNKFRNCKNEWSQ